MERVNVGPFKRSIKENSSPTSGPTWVIWVRKKLLIPDPLKKPRLFTDLDLEDML